MPNLDEKGSNSLDLIRFVLISDLSHFQERSSGYDGKDSFKNGSQERIKVEQSLGRRGKNLRRECSLVAWHTTMLMAVATHGHTHERACGHVSRHGPCTFAAPCNLNLFLALFHSFFLQPFLREHFKERFQGFIREFLFMLLDWIYQYWRLF